jgi:hypothetical protein
MAGYIRQSSFVDGDTITAALFNNEYNQLLNAFNNATGHSHDGTTAEGPVIGLIGDAGETSPNNKVLIDTVNNFVEFYVEVSSAPVQQLYISDGAIIPVTDSDVDLGTSSLYFKDAYIDSITTTGNIDVGGNLTVTGTTTFNGGTITMGDAATDNVVFGADVDSNIIPDDDDTYDLGSSSQEWRNLYIDGTANIDSLVADTADINGGTVDGSVIGGTTAAAGTFTTLSASTSITGTLATAAQPNITSVGTLSALTVTGEITANGGIALGDDDVATFGASDDLQIYHDGSNSRIKDAGTGYLAIDTNGSDIRLTSNSFTEYMAKFEQDGAVELYYDSDLKLATTSTGIDVVGVITTDGLTTSADINFGDSDKAVFGAGSDLQIYHDGTHSRIDDVGTGKLILRGNDAVEIHKYTGEYMITAAADGAVSLYHNDSLKLATTSTGIDVTGVITTDGLTTSADINFGDSDKAIFGEGNDLQIYHDGSNSFIREDGVGSLRIQGADLELSNPSEIKWLKGYNNDRIELFFNNSLKLATTATGIDVTGTATMDGLTVDKQGAGGASGSININGTADSSILMYNSAGTANERKMDIRYATATGYEGLYFRAINDANNDYDNIARFDTKTGDISFYEDTGTSPALFWDASAESLGIGTTSPAALIHGMSGDLFLTANSTSANSGQGLYFQSTTSGWNTSSAHAAIFGKRVDGSNGYLRFDTKSSGTTAERLRIDSSGALLLHPNNISRGLKITSGTTEAVGSDTTYDTVAAGYGKHIFKTDGTERMRIDSSGNVIVNNGGSGNGIVKINGATGNTEAVIFQRGGTEASRIGHANSADLTFSTGSGVSEAMRIDTSGNLLVGKTSLGGVATVGAELRGTDGYVIATSSSDKSGWFGRNSTDGDIVGFYKDGTTVGSIGTRSSGGLVVDGWFIL